MHKNREYLLSPCVSLSQLIELRASKAVWCERRWDCHGTQASHKLWVCSCSMDRTGDYIPACDRSHGDKISQAYKSLEIICTQELLGKSWSRCLRRKYPRAAQSKTLLGVELGKAIAGAGSALDMDLLSSTICDIQLLLFSIKTPMI